MTIASKIKLIKRYRLQDLNMSTEEERECVWRGYEEMHTLHEELGIVLAIALEAIG
jgi:hypothetical protein